MCDNALIHCANDLQKYSRLVRRLPITISLVLVIFVTITVGPLLASDVDLNVADLSTNQNHNSTRNIRLPHTALTEKLDAFTEAVITDTSESPAVVLLAAITNAPMTDPWVSACYYALGMSYYKKGSHLKAVEYFDLALQSPEGLPGKHMSAQQMKMVSLMESGATEDAIAAARKLQIMDGPESLKGALVQRAALLEAQMRTKIGLTNKVQSIMVESNYAFAKSLGGLPAYQKYGQSEGTFIRSRILNLLNLGDTNAAVEVGAKFLAEFPRDSYSALVALDLERIRIGKLTLSEVSLLEICTKYPVESRLGASVIYELAVAHYKAGHFPEAISEADHVLKISEINNESLPVSDGLLSSTLGLKTFIYERMGRLEDAKNVARELEKRFPLQPDSKNAHQMLRGVDEAQKKEIGRKPSTFIRLLLMFTLISASFIVFIQIVKKSKMNPENSR